MFRDSKENKEINCQYCDKKFTSKQNIKNHESICKNSCIKKLKEKYNLEISEIKEKHEFEIIIASSKENYQV